MSFSIVTVAWNSADDLARMLGSIELHLRPLPEIVVVDNASTDASVDVVRAAAPLARLVALSENRGFGAASNAAVATS